MMKIIGILAFVIAIVGLACIEIGLDKAFPTVEPQWSGPVVRIPLMSADTEGYLSGFEFSTDSRLICVFQYPWDSGVPYERYFRRAVYDLQGNEIKEAVDPSNGVFTAKYRNLFRLSIPSSSHPSDDLARREDSLIREKWRQLPFVDLLLKTNSWLLTDDLSEVLCLMTPAAKGEKTWTLELWTLAPKLQKKWSATLKDGFYDEWDFAGFYKREGKAFIVIADSLSDHSQIISAENGLAVGQVDHPDDHLRAPSDHNVASAFALDPDKRLLAVAQDRRVKVFSLDPPYPLLEQYLLPEPYAGDPTSWDAAHMQFAGVKYLLVDYVRGYKHGMGIRFEHSPGAYKRAYPTMIYNLKTGKPVWQTYAEKKMNIKLSPDGKKLAIQKGKILEVGDFVPQ